MTLNVGFVLLTHDKPLQAARLVRKLNIMFEFPPIAWHHDFNFCTLPDDCITKNISLVRPHFKTGWGRFAVVDAMLAALEMLFQRQDSPDWFILLSGADYPIKPASTIVHDLSASDYDVHMHYERIRYKHYERDWQRVCYNRYCALKFRIPLTNRRLHRTDRTITIRNPLFAAPFTPFSKDLLCFAGEHWFSAKKSAAEHLINFHKTKPALANHYRSYDNYVIVPEESYYQTVLCNSHLKLSNNYLRYVDWSGDKAHPKILLLEDLKRLENSDAHFARKFDANLDARILDALDELIPN